uniref:Putative conserved secreted protein n=1 Tax=Panstrongylus lignarius TaxID=156445 RepID=A0A224XL13_9HEMI
MKVPILLLLLFGITFGEKKATQNLCAIDVLRNNILEKITKLWDETGHAEWQYLAQKKNGLDGELVIEFKVLCDQLDNFTIPILPETILNSIWSWPVLEEETNNINRLYSTFRKLQARPDPEVFAKSWEDLAYDIIRDNSKKKSAFKSLEIIHDLVYVNGETEKSIFNSAEQSSDDQICKLSQSTNQLMFNMYTVLQMTQLKAYTMIQFSWMLLRVYNKGNFSLESNLMRQTYLERLQQQALIVRSTMVHSKNDLWKCDPKTHIEGQTYTEITRFLQGFIVNEVDMNSDNTCRENCGYYQYSRQHTCFQNLFCSKQAACRGNIVKCTFVDSDMWICLAPRWGKRRYDWIEYENGRILGDKKSCSRGVTKVDSWWRWLFWHCSYCFCYCDDSSDPLTNRYFNLREVTSDVENNKVVTGIRFIKASGVIHIQIQEGELLKYGEINATSILWRPIDEYNIDTKKAGTDYHMLTWEHRAVDLDDLILPKDHLLTGIKFRKIGGHLNLEIRGSEFDITTGKLKHSGDKSIWVSNDNTDASYYKPRTKVELYKPDIPTKRIIGENVPDSSNDQYIEFTSTDVNADAGQTAVPFIDTQLVAPQPPIALTGAGIYHRGTTYSGGFIAPKVFTYDYSEQIMNFYPEINEADN